MFTAANEEASVLNVLTEIRDGIRSANKDSRLWDVHDIADYLKYSTKTVQNRIINIQGFPQPINLPTTDNGGYDRWEPAEIKAWAKRHKKRG